MLALLSESLCRRRKEEGKKSEPKSDACELHGGGVGGGGGTKKSEPNSDTCELHGGGVGGGGGTV